MRGGIRMEGEGKSRGTCFPAEDGGVVPVANTVESVDSIEKLANEAFETALWPTRGRRDCEFFQTRSPNQNFARSLSPSNHLLISPPINLLRLLVALGPFPHLNQIREISNPVLVLRLFRVLVIDVDDGNDQADSVLSSFDENGIHLEHEGFVPVPLVLREVEACDMTPFDVARSDLGNAV